MTHCPALRSAQSRPTDPSEQPLFHAWLGLKASGTPDDMSARPAPESPDVRVDRPAPTFSPIAQGLRDQRRIPERSPVSELLAGPCEDRTQIAACRARSPNLKRPFRHAWVLLWADSGPRRTSGRLALLKRPELMPDSTNRSRCSVRLTSRLGIVHPPDPG